MLSLRRLSAITLIVSALLLASLVFAIFRQNSLSIDYRSIVHESESTIFLYTTIQDQATQGLILRERSQLLGASKELEQLQVKYFALLDNSIISSQYKLSFLQDLDFGKLIVNLKNVSEKLSDSELTLQIISQLRLMNKQLLQFDRVVVNEMRNKVMEYQKIAMILMGLTISIVCYNLIIIYVNAVKPIVSLSVYLKKSVANNEPVELGREIGKSVELNSIVTSFNCLLSNNDNGKVAGSTQSRREFEFVSVANEAINRLNGIINYSQLLSDTCDKKYPDDDLKKIINKIIDNGENCATVLKKWMQ